MGENLEHTQVGQDSVQSWAFMKLLWAYFSLRIHWYHILITSLMHQLLFIH